jgi:hypothetical protein
VFAHIVEKDVRSLLFDARRHRNKCTCSPRTCFAASLDSGSGAHQHVFDARDTYRCFAAFSCWRCALSELEVMCLRALDVILQLLQFFAKRVQCDDEIAVVQLALDGVVLEMVQRVVG